VCVCAAAKRDTGAKNLNVAVNSIIIEKFLSVLRPLSVVVLAEVEFFFPIEIAFPVSSIYGNFKFFAWILR